VLLEFNRRISPVNGYSCSVRFADQATGDMSAMPKRQAMPIKGLLDTAHLKAADAHTRRPLDTAEPTIEDVNPDERNVNQLRKNSTMKVGASRHFWFDTYSNTAVQMPQQNPSFWPNLPNIPVPGLNTAIIESGGSRVAANAIYRRKWALRPDSAASIDLPISAGCGIKRG
jgi:hypothetical protein